jgi:hypothetical protein
MSDHLNLSDFLLPVNLREISSDEHCKDGQIGNTIDVYAESFPDLDEADIVIVGCGEQRGSGLIRGKARLRISSAEVFTSFIS